jgi:hypothetical protein
MAKIVVINHLTLDGVMQSPGRPEEDTRRGFAHGGWGSRNSDEEMLGVMYARVNESAGCACCSAVGRTRRFSATGTPRTPGSRKGSTTPPSTSPRGRCASRSGGVGSGDLIETLMRRDLIDEYLLVIHPLLLGTGRRMFADGVPPAALRLVDSKTTAKGVVIASYQTLVNEPDSQAGERHLHPARASTDAGHPPGRPTRTRTALRGHSRTLAHSSVLVFGAEGRERIEAVRASQ